MPTKRKLRRWRVSLIRKRGEFLGYVEAADEAGAIKQAIELFGIADPDRQSRLVARRVK